MRNWMKATGALALLSLVLLATTGMALAGPDTHIYGMVYVDANLNGVWDEGEEGYGGLWQEYWEDDEYIEEYVGTSVSFHAGDPDNAITLESAVMTDFSEALEANSQSLCSPQDFLISDGPDEDEDPDFNWSSTRPCVGTFGLRPAGEEGTVWTVAVTVPDGYVATTPTSVMVTSAEGATQLVEFGIAPAGAGGVPADTTVEVEPETILMPATGSLTLGIAALALVVGGGSLVAGSKLRK